MRRLLIGFGLTALITANTACSSDNSTGGGGGGSSGDASVGGGGSGGSSTGGTGGASDACKLPQDPGPCDAAINRWWFNSATGKCEAFTYGGCQGNDNNFENAVACVQACAPNTTNACDAVTCGSISTCVYFGDQAACAVACGEGCAATEPCGCGNSCPGCKDCVQVCVPKN